MSEARVEPYLNPKGVIEPGVYRFFCPCGYEDNRFGCSRLVNDSEPNFSCEKPVIDAADQKCKYRHKLAPLVAAYVDWKAKEDAKSFLAGVEAKKREALKTLGITETELNTIQGGTMTVGGNQ